MVGITSKHVLQLPCLQWFVIVPYMPLFLIFVARSSGIGLIVPCTMGILFGCSVSARDLLQFLNREKIFSSNSSASAGYNYCCFSWVSVCRESIVHPQYINHKSTQYIPNIEVATRLSQVFIWNLFLWQEYLVCDGYVGPLLHM